MKATVVLNASAGSIAASEASATVSRVRVAFARTRLEAEVLSISHRSFPEAAWRAAASGADVVVLGGGDGTLATGAGPMGAANPTQARDQARESGLGLAHPAGREVPMRFLFRLFLLFVVVALVWVFRAPILDRLGPIAGAWARPAGSETRGASGTAERTTRGRLSDLDFSVDSIAQELRATGRVVRRKVVEAGHQLEESTRDTRTTARLKARFALDPELKARDIGVDTDHGRVTLKGRVDSHEELARAIRMAVEEDDVLEVTSTIQVSARGPAAEHPSGAEAAPQPTATPVP